MQKSDYIFGIRAVMEAIQAGREIDKVLIKKELRGDLIAELIDLLKLHRIPVKRVPLQTIDRITRKN
nr:23S rRNA (guanosine(2251)-2'-O)-methyltransferase RlmB [Muribaculaceae bacterium]